MLQFLTASDNLGCRVILAEIDTSGVLLNWTSMLMQYMCIGKTCGEHVMFGGCIKRTQ